MSKSKTWADVKRGDVLDIAGRSWLVTKIKPKGKRAKVVVEYKGREAESIVKLSERVTIAKKGDGTKRGPMLDERGVPRRWATKSEHDKALGSPREGLPAGDASQVKPPEKSGSSPWDAPKGKTEKMLEDLMSAKLVGETGDERAGYYVPPVNVMTVAAHLALFHGGIPELCADDEARMIGAHNAQHAEALKGQAILAVNHWHTETRPKLGA